MDALRSFLNIPNQNDFVLIVAWLLAALRPTGPYPLLAISGEQGSAKTVLSKLLRALVDPNVAPVRALPREERELMIAANNGHLLAFDNLSGLPASRAPAQQRQRARGHLAADARPLHRRRGHPHRLRAGGPATTLRRRRNSLHPARAEATCAFLGGLLVTLDVKRHHRYFLTNDRELPGRQD
jgi:hypothetical protein